MDQLELIQRVSAKKRRQGITRDQALGIAARVWADADFAHVIMDPDACSQIADILMRVSDQQKADEEAKDAQAN